MSTSSAHEPLAQCPHCGCRELFLRKDFPQKIGLGIVVIAGIAFLILAASRAYFYVGVAVLVLAAIIDAALYFLVPTITVCYRCRAEMRNVPLKPRHGGFELAVGEKYRKRD